MIADVNVRSGPLPDFAKLVTALGGRPDGLLRKAGIGPDGTASYDALAQLFECAAAELDCPDFGMRLAAARAARGATKMLGPLDVAMRTAPTLGAALRYCSAHLHAYSDATQMCLEKLPDQPTILLLFDTLLATPSQERQIVEHALALTQHAIQAITAGRVRAREVWFTHEPLAPLPGYRAHFNAAPRFEQNMNGLLLDEQDLDLPMPDADPQLCEIATSFIDQRYPASTKTLGTRVRIVVTRLLAQGDCTHERVAAALGLHPRTLQRRLRDEGESFEAIKDRVRREVAQRCLRRPDISLARMTEILGYSETSVLSRSCHRWFSASPRQLRSAARGQRSAAAAATARRQ